MPRKYTMRSKEEKLAIVKQNLAGGRNPAIGTGNRDSP